MTDNREKRRSGINLYRRVSRGALRIWVVFVVLWIAAVMLMADFDRPAGWLGSCRDTAGALYVACLYETPMPASVPVKVSGQSGIPWKDLSYDQQSFLRDQSFDNAGEATAPRGRTTQVARSNEPQNTWVPIEPPAPRAELYGKMLEEFERKYPETATYQLVPISNLSSQDAAQFRHWVEPLRTERVRAIRRLIELCVGVPLAVLLGAFVVLRVGRWVWAGFAASP